ncbi:vam6/Vps39-like protein [Oncorhynchus kisutch]|uniref:vam6/Vps39-like protein n=1 Tax=Oncorhynchus kisutch TaxID=8019 RepID=UPI0012DDD90A|nr:vam6/Vps39-like protein [Oncorhynchus kisutch]
MHDAYEPVPILEKLPLQIDCLAAWEDWLLVGTKPGHLLLYRIKNNAGTNRFEVTLEKSNKNFSKKIQQLFVVSQYKILVSLLENNIHVHDLLTFQQITVVSKARGATLFACDLQQSPSGEAQLRMCVAVKKKLQLYYWKDREFHELQGDFSAPDIPKAMAWCQNSICVGFKRDYYLIRVSGAQNRKHCVHVLLQTPTHVIGLYPDLLPADYRKQLHYPNPLPSLSGAELEKAHLALIDYLTQKRSHLVKHLNDSEPSTPSPLMEGIPTIKSRKKLLQIIDTTLLKCYLHTNVALVSPLLRLDNNHCHIEESEYILKKAHKYSELIILYEKKGLHQKALQVLLDQSTKANSPLKGHERTVQYLQRLGMENLVIIFEFSPWVLKICPEDGLKIFTEDLTEVETLPRDKVLNFLKEGFKELTIPYLEHIVHVWEETEPEFHNVLIQLYLERVQGLMKQYLNSLPEGVPAVAAGKEEGDLGEFRNKLLCFLEVSTSYEPGRLISDFPFDGLLEERAVLLGRMGKHEQALFIYVHVLKDTHMAEEYCHRHYDKETDRSQDVYLSLLRMYLSPPDVHCLGPIKMELLEPQTNLMAALHVLELHHSKLNTTKAIDLLPANTQIREIRVFLESVLEEKAQRKRFDQVLKSLLQAEFLRVQEERIFHQQVKCIITEEKTCRVCKKKIGNSAFARYPNGVVVHYFCCKDRGVCPTEQ